MSKQTPVDMLAEQVIELRHPAIGKFLDVRGNVADYIKNNNSTLPHWRIDTDRIDFYDNPEGLLKEGAFAGYKSAGYIVNDLSTRNYFPDKASKYIKTLLKNSWYEIPPISRYGTRAKIFFPTEKSFKNINQDLLENFFSKKGQALIGGKHKDVRFTFHIEEAGFEATITMGPMNKNEVRNYMRFESNDFSKAGLFIDLDFYKTDKLNNQHISEYIKKSSELLWNKAENIAEAMGL